MAKIEVKFYEPEEIDESLLKFAVMIAKTQGKWVFCKHKERDTLEVPGGHREAGEDIFTTAGRELYEETGAKEYDIAPVCVYSVLGDESETFGMLYFADISEFEKELHSEIERIEVTDDLPANWTYPLIQPKLLEEAKRRGVIQFT